MHDLAGGIFNQVWPWWINFKSFEIMGDHSPWMEEMNLSRKEFSHTIDGSNLSYLHDEFCYAMLTCLKAETSMKRFEIKEARYIQTCLELKRWIVLCSSQNLLRAFEAHSFTPNLPFTSSALAQYEAVQVCMGISVCFLLQVWVRIRHAQAFVETGVRCPVALTQTTSLRDHKYICAKFFF